MPERSQAQLAFGRAIKRYRNERDLTQEGLAGQADIHPKHVGALERGEKNPTLASILKLANGLGVSASELVGLTERLRR